MPSYGDSLSKTQLPIVNKQLQQSCQFLLEFREFLKERSQLEKEYSNKLENITKKFRNKKIFCLSNIKSDPFAPTSSKSPSFDAMSLSGSINSGNGEGLGLGENSTLLQALNSVFSDTEKMANERAVFSEYLISDISDPLKLLTNKVDEERKKLFNFSKKITEERDKIYNEKDKCKARYDESCSEVLISQAKQEKTMDTKTLEKLQKQYYQDVIDRNNNKNLYILSVQVANEHKRKHYEKDVPALLDLCQSLNEFWIEHLKSFCLQYIELENNCLKDSQELLINMKQSSERIDRNAESQLFIENNKSDWSPPGDFQFSSYQQFMEDDKLIDEYSSKVYLFNKKYKNQMELNDLESEISAKESELKSLKQEYDDFDTNPTMDNVDEVYQNMAETWRQLVLLKNNELTNSTEIEIIQNNIGSSDLSGQKHNFKNTSFTIPTTCDYCENTIWGLNRHGSTCKDCKYNCHTKCEFKVPPNCSQVKGGGKSSRKDQIDYSTLKDKTAPFLKNSMSATSTHTRQPLPQSFVQPSAPPYHTSEPTSPVFNQHSYVSPQSQFPTAKAIYAYDAADHNELSIAAGDIIDIIEADDGSGWVKAKSHGREGLVPATYIEVEASSSHTQHEATYTPSVQVRVLYDFEAQSEYDLTIHAGDIITLTRPDDDSGWSEGTLNGVTGQFPSNYVEII